jgi:hypothetical protein
MDEGIELHARNGLLTKMGEKTALLSIKVVNRIEKSPFMSYKRIIGTGKL